MARDCVCRAIAIAARLPYSHGLVPIFETNNVPELSRKSMPPAFFELHEPQATAVVPSVSIAML